MESNNKLHARAAT